jgi:carbon-monoxide dehydrogenase medium subunit
VSIQVRAAGRHQGSAYEKFAHPASRYAVVGAAALVTVENGAFTTARVALGGLLPHARRSGSVERAVIGKRATEQAIADAADVVTDDLREDVSGDIFASAEYRVAMASVYIRRALTTAVARAVT